MSNQFHRNASEFATIQLHGGQQPDSATNARAVPIYASTSFCFESSAHGAEIFRLNSSSFSYSRVRNPTVDVFEKRMTLLEGGVAAVATATGQAAKFLAVSALAGAGDNIISSNYCGGNCNQFKATFKRFGIEVKLVNGTDIEEFKSAIDGHTKAIVIGIIANDSVAVVDIPAVAKVAHENGIPLIVDNTAGMGGYLFRPIDHGADIVVHSTEFLGGQTGGIIIDSGNFPWSQSPHFPSFTTPYEPYHGVIFTSKFGKSAYAAKLRAELSKDIGPCLSPFGAFGILTGLETLSLRAERCCVNALGVARWLENNPNVESVFYPGLPGESHERAESLFREGYFGGVLSFRIKGGGDAQKMVDNMRLANNPPSYGTKMAVIQPQDSELGGIIVSVGIEALSDIIADFEGAFNVVFQA